MTGAKIIKMFEDTINKKDPSLMSKVQVMAANAQMKIHDLHARVIACHCECLGMNAENMLSAINGSIAPFGQEFYLTVMQKWGMVDEKGEVII